MYKNCKFKSALSNYGEKLKTQIEDTRIRMNEIASLLAKYEAKARACQNYKAIVQENTKVMNELQHVFQALSLLNCENCNSPLHLAAAAAGKPDRGTN